MTIWLFTVIADGQDVEVCAFTEEPSVDELRAALCDFFLATFDIARDRAEAVCPEADWLVSKLTLINNSGDTPEVLPA